jgi:hypothetical protein
MIIGLNGAKGSGKNTVASILERNWGFKAVGFADKLKQSAAALFHIDPKEWDKIKNDPGARIILKYGAKWDDQDGSFQSYTEKSVTGREFLQRYGTEAHREIFGYDFLVNALLDDLKFNSVSPNWTIYDARFNNELIAIREMGGKIIQVRRPGHNFDLAHASESPPDLDLIHYVVNNDGTFGDLEWRVNALVKEERLADQRQ